MSGARRAIAGAQGASYVFFALWAFLGRRAYVERHELEATSPWVLNAHAGWMGLVGALLVRRAVRGVDGEAAAVGLTAAAGLAANDLVLRNRIPRIYRSDLAWESLLAVGWLVARRRSQQ